MTTERIRTTISLDPEALEIFKRMAEAGNMSVSRCMGDWLTDTADAAQMITLKMEEAKSAPMRVLREMRALVAGMDGVVNDAEREVRGRRAEGRASGTGRGGSGPNPPSSNTGVLVPPVPPSPIPQRNQSVGKKT
jgi:hypothetical protein